uniref:Acetylcholine receptor subunit alpha-type deg-3 n=1 Tax=Strongyloides papillosus TaxID=174720 RepID=A0A0N5C913_STREA
MAIGYNFLILYLIFIQFKYGSTLIVNATLTNLSRKIDDGRISLSEYEKIPHIKLTKDLLDPKKYDTRVRPVSNHSRALKIYLSMTLYQIIDVNEPEQNIKLNMWMIQRWHDEMLDWNPKEYNNIETLILPSTSIWKPDTYIYNSVVMNKDDTERHMNVRIDSTRKDGKLGANISFLYPAIYTTTCRLNVRFFPYEQENCTLTISSWTNDKSALDYYADAHVNLENFIRNEEWDVISFKVFRHEYKYACCEQPWVILQASLVMRRKPLYYLVNLIIPTSIITLVAITGFFTPGSTSNDRTEKINLGITTLLAMSILMLMVCDQMPTTSEFVPLIAWFYLSIIIIISIGTFLTSIVLSIHSQRQYGKLPSDWVRYFFFVIVYKFTLLTIPSQLKQMWIDCDNHPEDIYKKRKINLSKSQDRFIYPTNVNSYEKNDHKQDFITSKLIKSSLTNKSQDVEMKILKYDNEDEYSRNHHTEKQHNKVKKRYIIGKSKKCTNYDTNNLENDKINNIFKKLCHGSSRQIALEWEFLASILDRILLISFGSCVIIVTFGMMAIGVIAQHSYDMDIEA